MASKRINSPLPSFTQALVQGGIAELRERITAKSDVVAPKFALVNLDTETGVTVEYVSHVITNALQYLRGLPTDRRRSDRGHFQRVRSLFEQHKPSEQGQFGVAPRSAGAGNQPHRPHDLVIDLYRLSSYLAQFESDPEAQNLFPLVCTVVKDIKAAHSTAAAQVSQSQPQEVPAVEQAARPAPASVGGHGHATPAAVLRQQQQQQRSQRARYGLTSGVGTQHQILAKRGISIYKYLLSHSCSRGPNKRFDP